MSNLSFCSESDAALIGSALDAIHRGLGEKVRAVMVVGPAVPPARHRLASPLELLVVCSDLPVPALSNLAHQARDCLSGGVRLRLLTERELLRSADVFTLELSEAQARHVLLHGDDPFAELHFTKGELRLSLEQALRRLARQLRQGVLGSVSDESARPGALEFLHQSIDRLAVIAANVLRLTGQDGAGALSEADLIGGLAEQVEVDAQPSLKWVGRLRDGDAFDDPVPALADLLLLVEAATSMVDRLGAGVD